MEEKREDKQYLYILIPLLIMCFWPFPSKWLGYSIALYISDAILIGTMFFIGFKNRYKIKETINNKFLFIFFVFNIIATLVALIRTSFGGIRQFAEIIRVLEWFVIYNYFYNVLKDNSSHNIENNIYKCIWIIMIPLSVITLIELFDLPLKEMALKNIYEMGKSGNIFDYFNRISGTFKNPNMYGVFLSIITVILFVSKMNNKKKIPLLIFCIMFLYYTGSRTALIATVIAYIGIIGLKLIVEKNKKIIWQPVAVVGILLMIIIFIMIFNKDILAFSRLNKLFEALSTFGERLQMWESYSDDIRSHLILGNGTIKSQSVMFDNVFVQYIFYYGIFGLLTLIAFFIYNIKKAIRLYLDNKDNIGLFCVAIEMIIIISGVTIQILDVTQLTFLYFFALAYVDTKKEEKNIGKHAQKYIRLLEKK